MRDEIELWTWRIIIAVLVVIALIEAVKGSVRSLHPEIVVETCSFLLALSLVMLERRAQAKRRRTAVLGHIASEIRGNAAGLCGGNIARPCEDVMAQVADLESGLRFYYPRLVTSAATTGVLSDMLDGAKDRKLLQGVASWIESAERYNARLAMAEQLLFFLPATEEAMAERLRLHVSILSGPVAKQRDALVAVCALFESCAGARRIPHDVGQIALCIRAEVEQFNDRNGVVEELEARMRRPQELAT